MILDCRFNASAIDMKVGTSARAWLYRMRQVLCVPREQGLQRETGPGNAGSSEFGRAIERTSAAW